MAPPTPAAPHVKSAPVSLRDCLAPLVAAALESSLLVHKWGTTHGSLMRASTVMELCAAVAAECTREIERDERARGVEAKA